MDLQDTSRRISIRQGKKDAGFLALHHKLKSYDSRLYIYDANELVDLWRVMRNQPNGLFYECIIQVLYTCMYMDVFI